MLICLVRFQYGLKVLFSGSSPHLASFLSRGFVVAVLQDVSAAEACSVPRPPLQYDSGSFEMSAYVSGVASLFRLLACCLHVFNSN